MFLMFQCLLLPILDLRVVSMGEFFFPASFLLLILFGEYILLNLFLAILINKLCFIHNQISFVRSEITTSCDVSITLSKVEPPTILYPDVFSHHNLVASAVTQWIIKKSKAPNSVERLGLPKAGLNPPLVDGTRRLDGCGQRRWSLSSKMSLWG